MYSQSQYIQQQAFLFYKPNLHNCYYRQPLLLSNSEQLSSQTAFLKADIQKELI